MISLKILAGVTLILILLLISLLHFYWAAGGRRFADGVFPELDSIKLFEPPPIATAIVGFGLMAMAVIVAANLEWIHVGDWAKWTRIGLWAIAVIFLVRAIGEFNYVGLFKRKKKDTLFGKNDTRYYSPLCLLMGVLGFMVLFG